jgi:hypothetical protein
MNLGQFRELTKDLPDNTKMLQLGDSPGNGVSYVNPNIALIPADAVVGEDSAGLAGTIFCAEAIVKVQQE